MRVEFVSILVGGITEGFDKITSVDFLLNKLRNLCQMAKLPTGSNFMMERAQLTGSDSIVENIFNKNIYIQEKDESLRYLLRTSLELQGYDVQENLDVELSLQPSIIILDIGNNSNELGELKKMKQLQNFVNTKFIVTTTMHEKSTILGAGADLYLPKPYDILDLIKWVEYFLRK
jgi:CheY-like chemotaxis protein